MDFYILLFLQYQQKLEQTRDQVRAIQSHHTLQTEKKKKQKL